MTISQGDAAQVIGEDVQFAVQRAVNDQLLAFVDLMRKVWPIADKIGIGLGESWFRRGIDKQRIHQIRKVVTGGAVNRPRFRQAFGPGKNFFCHHVISLLTAACVTCAGMRSTLQTPEILLRIVEPVGVVDTKPVDFLLPQQLQHEFMGLIKHGGIFLA